MRPLSEENRRSPAEDQLFPLLHINIREDCGGKVRRLAIRLEQKSTGTFFLQEHLLVKNHYIVQKFASNVHKMYTYFRK